MNSTTLHFTSVLAPHLHAYVAHCNALGKRSRSYRCTLRLLDRYLADRGVETLAAVTPSLLDAFLASRTRRTAKSFNCMLSGVTCFFRWLVLIGTLPISPVAARRRRARTTERPFLFDPDQARRLIEATRQLKDSAGTHGRARIYRMVFILLYGLGLRTGEAARLRLQDVDEERQLLEIHNTKFGKDRLVPFGPKIAAELRGYLTWRATRPAGLERDVPLFTYDPSGRQALCPTTITRTFQALVPLLNLSVEPGTRAPNPQCLRHSFAVGTLRRWYRTGADANANLFRLSTFMGHVDPGSTAIYLTITSDLLDLANERFARYAGPVLREVSP